MNISAQNDPPEIAEGDAVTGGMDEDGTPTPFSLILTASDPDGDALTWSIAGLAQNGSASVSETGMVSYTPNPGFSGSDSFTVQVSDGELADTITIHVNISAQNDPPEIAQGDAITIHMDEDGSPESFNLTLHASDPDEDPLTWSITTSPGNGTAQLSGTGTTQAVTYIPNPDYNGWDSFVVTVSDGLLTDTLTADVSISAQNDPPEIVEGDAVTVSMDEAGSPTRFDLTLNATDPDGDPLGWDIVTAPENGMAYVADTDGSHAIIDYIPDEGHTGTDRFEVRVSDGWLTDTIAVSVNILPLNDRVCDIICEQSGEKCGAIYMDEDGAPRPFDLTLNASDPDGDVLTWSIITAAESGMAHAEGTGYTKDISYIPDADVNGIDNFEVQVSDGYLTDSMMIYVCIAPQNDPPAFGSRAVTTAEQEMPYIYTVAIADPDDEDTHVITALDIPDWLELTANRDGTATLSGISPDIGVYRVHLQVRDEYGETATQRFAITVKENSDPGQVPADDDPADDDPADDDPADNDPADDDPADDDSPDEALPSVSGFEKTGNKDTPLAFSAEDFATHFADPASHALSHIRITSLPAHGTLNLEAEEVTVAQEIPADLMGSLTYHPNEGYDGADSFAWNGTSGRAYADASARVALTVRDIMPFIQITLTASANPLLPGEFFSYTIAYANIGSGPATGVEMSHVCDANLTYISATPEAEPGTWGRWFLPDLFPGDSGSITVSFQVSILSRSDDVTNIRNRVVMDFDQGSVSVEEDTGILFPMAGDIDGNEIVEMEDAILGLQILCGLPPVRPVTVTADVNDDQRIGMAETLYVLQKVSGLN